MKISSPRLLLLPALIALLFAGPAAQAQDATLDRARQMITSQSGKGRAAFDLLAPLESQRAGEPAYDYLLGLAAIDAGEFTRAVFALERVLAVEPNHPQARAEIARAYFQMGENRVARQEFEAVKASKPPAEVAAIVDRFLSALDDRQAPLVSGVSGFIEAARSRTARTPRARCTAPCPGAGGRPRPSSPSSVPRRRRATRRGRR